MFRHGAGSAVDRIRRLCPEELKASEEARASIDYLDKRRGNMRYGWLRRNGYCISSSHVEAAARILVSGITSPGKRPVESSLSARTIRILGHERPTPPESASWRR